MHRPLRSLLGTLLLVFCIVSCVVSTASAQKRAPYPEGTVRLVLEDGTTLVGTIVQEDEQELVVRSPSGTMTTVPRELVRSRTSLAGKKFSRVDPNRTRLFFAPTARPLSSGEGYVSFYEIFVPFAAVGATDRLTLSGGVTINPGDDRLFYAAPKLTVMDGPRTSAAVGGIGILATEGSGAGLLFALGTFGRSEAAATVGVAFGVAEGEFSGKPALLLGAEYQISNSFKLLTENYLLTGVEDGLLVSGGVRFFGDHLAADIGLITVPLLLEDAGMFPFLPWLGFAYNWGQ